MTTLSQMLPGLYATWNQGTLQWDLDMNKGGSWTQAIPDAAGVFPSFVPGLIQHATIDLSGWQRMGDDISFFPEGFSIQAPGKFFNNSSVNQWFDTLDIISTTKFTDQQLVDALSFNTAPGLPNARGDWDRVIYGLQRLMSGVTAGAGSPALANTMYVQDASLFGSGEPVAANILYLYRVIQPNPSDDGAVIVAPACRFITEGIFAEEKPLVHLDRMYRSYNSR